MGASRRSFEMPPASGHGRLPPHGPGQPFGPSSRGPRAHGLKLTRLTLSPMTEFATPEVPLKRACGHPGRPRRSQAANMWRRRQCIAEARYGRIPTEGNYIVQTPRAIPVWSEMPCRQTAQFEPQLATLSFLPQSWIPAFSVVDDSLAVRILLGRMPHWPVAAGYPLIPYALPGRLSQQAHRRGRHL